MGLFRCCGLRLAGRKPASPSNSGRLQRVVGAKFDSLPYSKTRFWQDFREKLARTEFLTSTGALFEIFTLFQASAIGQLQARHVAEALLWEIP